MFENMSFEYRQSIACLAQAIYDSGFSSRVDSTLIDWTSSWDSAVKKNPDLDRLAIDVENHLDYELSYNQCCNAISWVYRFSPVDWQHLLPKELATSGN